MTAIGFNLTLDHTLARVEKPKNKGLRSKAIAVLTAANTGSYITQEVLRIVPSLGASKATVSGISLFSRGTDFILGSAVTLKNGFEKLFSSNQVGDAEGTRRAKAEILLGALAVNEAAFAIFQETVSPTFAGTVDVLFFLGTLLNLIMSLWTMRRCLHFRSELIAILDNSTLEEKEQILQTLQFLKSRIHPTEEEILERLPTKQKIIDFSVVKFKNIARRTSHTAAIQLLKEVDQCIAATHALAPDFTPAKQLIHELLRHNLKKIILKTISVVSSILALAGLIAVSVFSVGTLPLILYVATTSLLGLSVLLYPLLIDNIALGIVDEIQRLTNRFTPKPLLIPQKT